MVFDGLADWECGLALAEINRCDRYRVVTVGMSTATVVTMAGVRITPQVALADLNSDEAAIFILPGGDRWESITEPALLSLLEQLDTLRVPIAGICSATVALARAGLLDERRHTSNRAGYLEQHVPAYAGQERYRDSPAVADSGVITASGVAAVEFAHELLGQLCVYEESDLASWFDLFKHYRLP